MISQTFTFFKKALKRDAPISGTGFSTSLTTAGSAWLFSFKEVKRALDHAVRGPCIGKVTLTQHRTNSAGVRTGQMRFHRPKAGNEGNRMVIVIVVTFDILQFQEKREEYLTRE